MRALLIFVLMLNSPLLTHAADDAKSPTNALRFFVVSDEKIPDGRYLDTAEFPKLGYIRNTPDLVVSNLQSVTTNTASWLETYQGKQTQKSAPAFQILMLASDSKRFSELTRTNLGHRLLLMLEERPLIAPVIMSPIESGSIQVRLGEKNDSGIIAAALTKFVQHE